MDPTSIHEEARQLAVKSLSTSWDTTSAEMQNFVGKLQVSLKSIGHIPGVLQDASIILATIKDILPTRSPSHLFDQFHTEILPILERWEGIKSSN